MTENSKMYILVKGSIPLGFALVSAAHASLQCYLEFEGHSEMGDWVEKSFRKVVCVVTDEQFERAKATEDHVVVTESDLEGQEVALAFLPRESWPEEFRRLPLYRSLGPLLSKSA